MTESTISTTDEPTPAPQDQLLGEIFTDPHAGEQALPAAQAVAQANMQVVVAIHGLNIPAATVEQAEELSGHGSPELRPASVAYQALLARRPALGASKGITPALFQAVIDKDRAYDTLGSTLGTAQSAVQGAVILSQSQVSTSVTTVAVYVTPFLKSKSFTDNQDLIGHFTPVAAQMDQIQTRTDAHDQRQTLKEDALHTALTDHTEEQAQTPLVGRLIEAADKGVDLLAHPDPTTPPAKQPAKKPAKAKGAGPKPKTPKKPKTKPQGTPGIPKKSTP